MEKNDEKKKQIIKLFIVVVILGAIAIVFNNLEKNNNSISNNQPNSDLIRNSNDVLENEISINGITESKLQNMRGLMDEKTFEIYQEYFENEGRKSIEQIEMEKSNETEIKVNENGLDHISTEEQIELEHDLDEALQKYGY